MKTNTPRWRHKETYRVMFRQRGYREWKRCDEFEEIGDALRHQESCARSLSGYEFKTVCVRYKWNETTQKWEEQK